jgi:hypothetical protein
METPTTPTKKCRHVAIVVSDTETAAAIAELFDRTSKCLALCNEFSKSIVTETNGGSDSKAITDISLRFATGLVVNYRGAGQMVADQTLFRNLEIDKRGLN